MMMTLAFSIPVEGLGPWGNRSNRKNAYNFSNHSDILLIFRDSNITNQTSCKLATDNPLAPSVTCTNHTSGVAMAGRVIVVNRKAAKNAGSSFQVGR